MTSLIAPADLFPQLSVTTQALFRLAYGVLLLGHLILLLPHGRRFFMSERWRGYAASSPYVDLLQNPIAYPLVMVLWLTCALLLVVGQSTVWAALLNLLLCRYFFVGMRWRGVLRGMGAPGFMTYWLAAAVFLVELSLHHAPSVRPLVCLVLQVDFALIMLSAGVYKLVSGFPQNHGLELGLANPEWGYWWRFYRNLAPRHPMIRTLNQLAWSTELAAAVLMLAPPTRFLGALLIMVSFAFIATHIRLALLCHMVMLCGVLFWHARSPGDRLAHALVHVSPPGAYAEGMLPALAERALETFLWTYLLVLPLAYAGIYYNFFVRKSLTAWLQRVLDAYTNFFGIIMWRVFTADLINFFPNVYVESRASGDRTLVSSYGWRTGSVRYSHVGESITLTSLFTTLKYYPSNHALFADRLQRYARTVPCPADCVLVFQYVSIRKGERRFEYVAVADYVVDLAAGTVDECRLRDESTVYAPHEGSPLHEGARPGSYAPLGG